MLPCGTPEIKYVYLCSVYVPVKFIHTQDVLTTLLSQDSLNIEAVICT